MKKLLPVLAALLATALAVSLSFGSSHREAPNTAADPTADDTDVYAYVANDATDSLTVVANWIPFEDPAGGPNFYNFDPKAHYYVNVDNTGDGRYDIRYEFQFKTHVRNGNSFLAAVPAVTGLGSANLNVYQTYTLRRELIDRKGKETRTTVLAASTVAPSDIGPKTMPNYQTLANQGITPLRGGGKVFAGQRDDPFFVDLGQTFDSINFRPNVATGNHGGGKDDVAGYNVNSIVLQVPKSQVTVDHKAVAGPTASNAVVGVWSSTERQRFQVTNDPRAKGRGGFVQVSRLGNPLVNEVVIPLGQKDRVNRTQPQNDAKNYGKYVVKPELAHLMNVLFNLGVQENNRTDIVTALLTGIKGVTQIGSHPAAADTLKVNLGVPPTPAGQQSRFGVLGGDNGGFPNGRRLADDVTDIELRVIGGYLLGKKLPLGDGVDQNDKAFLSSFPYVAPPTSGLDSGPKRFEPGHAATPGQP